MKLKDHINTAPLLKEVMTRIDEMQLLLDHLQREHSLGKDAYTHEDWEFAKFSQCLCIASRLEEKLVELIEIHTEILTYGEFE